MAGTAVSFEVVSLEKPEDVETDTDVAARHRLLREFGYKL